MERPLAQLMDMAVHIGRVFLFFFNPKKLNSGIYFKHVGMGAGLFNISYKIPFYKNKD
jgi:hypothetical protein